MFEELDNAINIYMDIIFEEFQNNGQFNFNDFIDKNGIYNHEEIEQWFSEVFSYYITNNWNNEKYNITCFIPYYENIITTIGINNFYNKIYESRSNCYHQEDDLVEFQKPTYKTLFKLYIRYYYKEIMDDYIDDKIEEHITLSENTTIQILK